MKSTSIHDQITTLEKQRFEYMTDNKFNELRALCDESLHYVHTSGTVDDIQALFKKLESGYYDYLKINYDIVEIMDRQDCVIVRANFYADLLVDKTPRQLQNRALSIWNKDNGELKLMHYQATGFSK